MDDVRPIFLFYRFIRGSYEDFSGNVDGLFENSDFRVDIRPAYVLFSIKADFPSIEAVKSRVQEFVDAWQVSVGVNQGPGLFELEYAGANSLYRDPAKSKKLRIEGCVSFSIVPPVKTLPSALRAPPEVPNGLAAPNYVRAMYKQYQEMRKGAKPLSSVGYFCITALETEAAKLAQGSRRRAAAQVYAIHLDVLNKLGQLTSEAGGPDARKYGGTERPFTTKEKEWVAETVRLLIKRAGEHAASPTGSLSQLSLVDLPPL